MNNSNKILIGVLIGVFISLLIGIVLFATNIISFKGKSSNEQQKSNNSSLAEETITNEDASKIANNILNKYYNEIGDSIYCGSGQYEFKEGEDLPYYTAENGFNYLPSSQFKSKVEIREYLNSYLSIKIIDKMFADNYYLEKDGKLYCMVPSKGLSSYVQDKSVFNVNEILYNEFYGKGEVSFRDNNGDVFVLHSKYKVIKENDNWLLDEIEEER